MTSLRAAVSVSLSLGLAFAAACHDSGLSVVDASHDARVADAAIPIDGRGADFASSAPPGDAGVDGPPSPVDGSTDGLRIQTTTFSGGAPMLDLLFVIDNSGSMKEEQQNLAKNFPVLMQALARRVGGLPDLHIGIVSTDVGAGGTFITGNPACNRPGGDRGMLLVKAGCGLDPAVGRFLMMDGAGKKNFTGNIESVFACLAEIGTAGCGFEHHLQAARLAFATNINPENEGFLRADAMLGIVFLTDEDDCSADPSAEFFADTQSFPGQTSNLRCYLKSASCNGQPIPHSAFMTPLSNCIGAEGLGGKNDLIPLTEMVGFFRDLKKNASQLVISGIIGWPTNPAQTPYVIGPAMQSNGQSLLDMQPICSSANGTAAPGLRLKRFIDAFGDNGTVTSICDTDLTSSLDKLGERLAGRSALATGGLCLPWVLADADANVDGLQPACSVRLRIGASESVVPHCAQGAAPCWRFEAASDAALACEHGQPRFMIERGNAPVGAVATVSCLTP